ncbi:MAG: amino acid permease [Gloeomargarita sp. SKYBB_i_bin120]|nr:amino acid permease [Gloeomargarita sp. SKYG98]MCS7291884.1 amino acid permease [Gloeomargarita sp. SKYB120]MDW8177444.1 amino acid permease [Gloeomargarita sp. SKYBB_i_bin120]
MTPAAEETVAGPRPQLTTWDGIALIVGIVVGVGIFETPVWVASNLTSVAQVLGVWLLGGVLSLVGGLCVAELGAAYPHAGGIYHYLDRMFGWRLAFLFGWARMTVIQSGSIALLAFVFGDYCTQLWSLGRYSASWYAAAVIVLLTGCNLLGVRPSKWLQAGLSGAKVLSLLLVVLAGWRATGTTLGTAAPTPTFNLGLALIFVLFTYGGWSEAAYISAELRNVQQAMPRVLLGGIGAVTVLYLLVNGAYLRGLGLAGVAQSQAVAADLMRQTFGPAGAALTSGVIALSALGAIQGTMITGARTNYALGQDFAPLRWLGVWNSRWDAPVSALVWQGAICLALVGLGTWTRKGFVTMVDYTAPVFWLFMLLTGVALLGLRWREPEQARPFCVPAYPWTPLLFCATCGYLLYASLAYTGMGALVGIAVLAVGLPLSFLSKAT